MHSPSPRERHLLAWTALACTLLWAALAAPFFVGRIYAADDLWAYHIPLRAFYGHCLRTGAAFDWLPHLFAGFYLTGEGQAGTYHPWHWLLYRGLALRPAVNLELLLTYPAMLAGAYVWLRRVLGRRDVALAGGLTFAFGGFNLLHFMHVNAIAVVAHIPWLLWLFDVALRDAGRRPRRAAWALAGIALLTGSQLLLGYPQYVWFSVLTEGAWVVLRTRRPRDGIGVHRDHRSRLYGVMIAKLLGLLIGGVQLLPTIDALAASQRSAVDTAFVFTGSLHPLNAVQVVAPYLFETRVVGQMTHELGLYFGAVPLLLVVWLLARRGTPRSTRRAAVVCLALGLAALTLALGKYGLVYRVQTWLPLVGGFRIPARYIVLVQLATSVLAALSLRELLRQQRAGLVSSWAELRPLWRLVGLSAVVAAAAPLVWDRELLAAWPLVAAGPALLLAAAACVACAARGAAWAIVALVLLTAVDLGAYGLSYAVYPKAVPFDRFIAAAPAPPRADGTRVAVELPTPGKTTARGGNHPLVRGLRMVDGYAGLEPASRLDYRRLAVLRAAGVGWVLRRPETETIVGLSTADEHWLAVPDPLPRARLVSQTVAAADAAPDLANVTIESTAVVEEPLDLPPGAPGDVSLWTDLPGDLRMAVDCPARRLLVVSERHHAGWQAEIDGRPRPVLRVNGDFLGCAVEAGRHEVRFTFRPASLRYGRWTTLAGLAATGLLLMVQLIRIRQAVPGADGFQAGSPRVAE